MLENISSKLTVFSRPPTDSVDREAIALAGPLDSTLQHELDHGRVVKIIANSARVPGSPVFRGPRVSFPTFAGVVQWQDFSFPS